VDVVEYYGHFPHSYRTALHVWEPKPHQGAGASVSTPANDPSTGFHNYGVLVAKEDITFYYDGVEVWRQKTPKEHNKPLMLLVNLALGSGYSIENTPNPSYLYVESIRAYSLSEKR
jgi:beta-glucanase (GH16 family)